MNEWRLLVGYCVVGLALCGVMYVAAGQHPGEPNRAPAAGCKG